MLPALRMLERSSPAKTSQVRAALAAEFQLSEADLAERLPSGRQAIFANRVAWAYSYLKQAGLITSPRRATYKITGLGREILNENPARIDIAFLSRFPGFQAFHQGSTETEVEPVAAAPVAPVLTPDEQIQAGYKRLRGALAAQLLERVRSLTVLLRAPGRRRSRRADMAVHNSMQPK